jgi:hypothetical protein
MENFDIYEDAIYKIDLSIKLIRQENRQESAKTVVQAYRLINDTPICEHTDVRAYVESIIGCIRSDKMEDAAKYMIELRNQVSRFQKENVSSLNPA